MSDAVQTVQELYLKYGDSLELVAREQLVPWVVILVVAVVVSYLVCYQRPPVELCVTFVQLSILFGVVHLFLQAALMHMFDDLSVSIFEDPQKLTDILQSIAHGSYSNLFFMGLVVTLLFWAHRRMDGNWAVEESASGQSAYKALKEAFFFGDYPEFYHPRYVETPQLAPFLGNRFSQTLGQVTTLSLAYLVFLPVFLPLSLESMVGLLVFLIVLDLLLVYVAWGYQACAKEQPDFLSHQYEGGPIFRTPGSLWLVPLSICLSALSLRTIFGNFMDLQIWSVHYISLSVGLGLVCFHLIWIQLPNTLADHVLATLLADPHAAKLAYYGDRRREEILFVKRLKFSMGLQEDPKALKLPVNLRHFFKQLFQQVKSQEGTLPKDQLEGILINCLVEDPQIIGDQAQDPLSEPHFLHLMAAWYYASSPYLYDPYFWIRDTFGESTNFSSFHSVFNTQVCSQASHESLHTVWNALCRKHVGDWLPTESLITYCQAIQDSEEWPVRLDLNSVNKITHTVQESARLTTLGVGTEDFQAEVAIQSHKYPKRRKKHNSMNTDLIELEVQWVDLFCLEPQEEVADA